jgi:hypothetical protein
MSLIFCLWEARSFRVWIPLCFLCSRASVLFSWQITHLLTSYWPEKDRFLIFYSALFINGPYESRNVGIKLYIRYQLFICLYQINTFKYILKIKYPRKILQIKVIIHKNVQKLIYRHNFDAGATICSTCPFVVFTLISLILYSIM